MNNMNMLNRLYRMISSIIVLLLIAGISTAGVHAASSPLKDYNNAVAARNTAKKEYEAAKEKYLEASSEMRKGSAGFFEWIRDNNTGWRKEDAEDALELLEKSTFRKYTEMGDEEDATGIENMKHAIKLFAHMQKLRDTDENIKDLPPVTIRSIYMARAQMNANASSVTGRHMWFDDEGYKTNESTEALAWGAWNPFELWYDMEKDNYNKTREYILQNYGYDINIDEEYDKFVDEHDDFNVILDKYGELGHYYTVMLGKTAELDMDTDTIIYGTAERTIFGLAIGYGTACLTGDAEDQYNESYSIDEYTSLFNQYYNSIAVPEEKKAMEKAEEKYDECKEAVYQKREILKKSLRLKPSVSRKWKTITVKWKKNKLAQKYEISVSSGKSSTKIYKTTVNNKIKIKSKARKYIKVRPIINNNGEIIKGSWSKVIRK